MAVVKDWAEAAAKQIEYEMLCPAHHDGVLECMFCSARLSLPSVKAITEVIVAHSPFKVGVAYMPVPRCDGCKHWGENEGGEGLGNGRCGYADYHPNKLRAEMYEAVLTAADFGCVQWEAK